MQVPPALPPRRFWDRRAKGRGRATLCGDMAGRISVATVRLAG